MYGQTPPVTTTDGLYPYSSTSTSYWDIPLKGGQYLCL